MQATRLFTVLIVFSCFSATGSAQVFDSGPSDPALFTEVFNLPGDVLPSNSVGGVAGETTQVNIAFDGSVDGSLRVEGSEVNINGATVGDINAVNGSELNISSGFVGRLVILSGSVANVSGIVSDFSRIGRDGVINLSGGGLGSDLRVEDGGVLNIRSGSVGRGIDVQNGGTLNIFGSDFTLDGVLLDDLVAGEAFTILSRDVTLSGLNAEGSTFRFNLNSDFVLFQDQFEPGSTLTVTQVLAGDFNVDGEVDGDDVDLYIGNLDRPATGQRARLNLDGDGIVTVVDHDLFVTTLVVTSNGVTGALLGDVDLDGTVDVLSDAFALVGSLGQSSTSRSQGDLNADGMVTVLGDAFILVGQLGQSNDP